MTEEISGIIGGFYGIVNTGSVGFEPVATAIEMLRGGARVIQLRCKLSTPGETLFFGEKIMELKSRFQFTFIVNDDPWIAFKSGADGVHLGQKDVSCREAREIIGPDKIIGVSTHNDAELFKALQDEADYVGFGPIFHTRSKINPDPVQGLKGLERALGISTVPVVAIGGIKNENIRDVISTGVQAVASIDSVYSSNDICGTVAAYTGIFDEMRKGR